MGGHILGMHPSGAKLPTAQRTVRTGPYTAPHKRK